MEVHGIFPATQETYGNRYLTNPAMLGTSTAPKVYKNFIDGEWVDSSTGETFENRNPADTRDVVGIFQKSGKADVDAAVEAARSAFAKWRLYPLRAAPRLSFAPPKCCSSAREEYSRDMTARWARFLRKPAATPGSHRHSLLFCGRRPPHVWADHTLGVT